MLQKLNNFELKQRSGAHGLEEWMLVKDIVRKALLDKAADVW